MFMTAAKAFAGHSCLPPFNTCVVFFKTKPLLFLKSIPIVAGDDEKGLQRFVVLTVALLSYSSP